MTAFEPRRIRKQLMQIIAIAGLAQCGKTTLANEIARIAFERGMNPKMMSFAEGLKTAAAAVGASKETQPELYRKFCQEVGGKFRDPDYVPGVTNPDWWVNLTAARIDAIAEEEGRMLNDHRPPYAGGTFHERVLIFDDVRYPNELAMLKRRGAVLIYLDRELELPDPTAKWRQDVSERMAYHFKEDGEDRTRTFNYTVSSVGTKEAFLARCRPFIPVWLGLEVLGLPNYPEPQ